MQKATDWVELRKKPIQIGKCSRGFIIDKDKIRLNSSETYVIRIIKESNYVIKDGFNPNTQDKEKR